MKILLTLYIFVALSTAAFSQITGVKGYGELTAGLNLYFTDRRLPLLQLGAGVILPNNISFGAGLGISNRNYEYFYIPVEIGYFFNDDLLQLTFYGAPTFPSSIYERREPPNGWQLGTDWKFQPRFRNRYTRLVLAFGLIYNLEREAPGRFVPGIDPPSSLDAALGFRIRVGTSMF